MQNGCANGNETCYFSCRKSAARYNDALNSRAGAAEKLNISESSLRDYETGLTPVPVDVVVRMSDLYNAPELQVAYCKNDCPIGKYVCRNISTEVKEIDQITCSLLSHMEEAKENGIITNLLSIASDGKIGESERGRLQKVVELLETISKDISDLRLAASKRGDADGCSR